MNRYYLTEIIYIQDNIMYIQGKKIHTNNWHHILKDYGWGKLPLQWIKKLNKLADSKTKNSRFGVLDCEEDGDCFFHCIANALNERDRDKGEQYNSIDIRNNIADSITEEEFQNLISYYRIMKDADDFDENWDPYKIESIGDFKRQIRKSGNNYWGDFLLLSLILQILRLNIYILNHNEKEKEPTIYNTLNEYNSKYNTIFLLYENNCHFRLVGYFDDNQMISYFSNENIPLEFIKLFNLKY